jgi:hypothetical protein
MKTHVVVLLGFLASQMAFAETLTCYNARSQKNYAQMSAKIISDSKLEDVTFARWLKTSSTGLTDYASVRGKLNSNNRSPYKGKMTYDLENGDTLSLPADLSAKGLQKALVGGENGVIMGNAKDWNDGAGNHYSYQLRCVSDKR